MRMIALRTAAWLSSGVVLVTLLVNIMSLLVFHGLVTTGLPVMLLTLIGAALIGALLCRRASRRKIFLMGGVIAGYMPALYAIGCAIALGQDLLRGSSLPGTSLKALLEIDPLGPSTMVMMIIAAAVSLSGLCVARRKRGAVVI